MEIFRKQQILELINQIICGLAEVLFILKYIKKI